MKKKSMNNILIFLIVILSICLIGGVSYIIYDSFFEKEIVEDVDNSEDDVENEITDVSLNNTIKKYVGILESIRVVGNDSTNSKFNYWGIYASEFKNSDISHDNKLFVVLEQLYIDNLGKSPVTTNYEFATDYLKTSSTQIDVSDVEDLYKNLYGSNDYQHKSLGKCPGFTYDSVNGKYYGASGCGGISPYSVETYIYSITTKGDELYAYVSLATCDREGDTPVIYTDFAMTKVYNGNVKDTSDIVNESNYKDFSQYKFVFTKKGSSYSFEKIEILK